MVARERDHDTLDIEQPDQVGQTLERTENCQMLEAGVRQHREWGNVAEGRHILVAVARYVAAYAPTPRAQLQTAMVARRLSLGQTLHDAAEGEADE